MPDSGGVRSDITLAHHMVPNENRQPRWRVRDSAGNDILDFTAYTFSFYWLPYPEAPLAEALLVKTSAAGAIDKSGPPWAMLSLAPADWVGRNYDDDDGGYSLWRTDPNNERELAYGLIAVHRKRRRR